MRVQLVEPVVAEGSQCAREQEAKLLERHGRGLVLGQVLVDELGKGERPRDSVLPPQLLKRSHQRRPRVLLARKATALNAFRTAPTDPVPVRPQHLGAGTTPQLDHLTLLKHADTTPFASRVCEWFDDHGHFKRQTTPPRPHEHRASHGRLRSAPMRYLCCDTIPGIHTQYARLEEPFMSVPHALLALLSEGPKYGLRLQSEFESRTGEVWPLNVGQVYTTLQRLERDGLIEADGEGERSRKRYRITSAGARELAEWLRTPPELVPPPRDELVIKVLVALQIPGIDIHQLLQVHRRYVVEVMQRYTQVKAAAAEDDVPLALVADAELFRLEAIVRWLDAADVRLKQRMPVAPAAVADLSLEPTRTMEVSQ